VTPSAAATASKDHVRSKHHQSAGQQRHGYQTELHGNLQFRYYKGNRIAKPKCLIMRTYSGCGLADYHQVLAATNQALLAWELISFSNIHKQYGKQLIFVDASFQLNPGEKVGLVGPNGAGKTTLFRMVVGEESPDEGEVSVPKKMTIGYFRQDVEEMKGRSVLDEAIAGSGRAGDLHHELEDLQRAMEDPARSNEMDKILDRFGHVQEEYDHLGGYALEAQAREVLHGLGFQDDQIDGDVGALSGGWKMRVALARVLLGRPDVLLMDEPTNHLDIESIVWLEHFLKSYDGAVLMTSHDREFMNRIVSKIAEIDAGEIIAYSGDYDFYERERTIRETNQQAAAVHAGQGAALYRPFPHARGQGSAGAEPHQGAGQDRQDRAAEEAPGSEVRVSRPAALGRPGRRDRGSAQELRQARDL
jgi:ATPase subunit of ABC transporter with duplicated ATPase domains